jgi:acetoin utilization deacetylase AcuC-like enzyme
MDIIFNRIFLEHDTGMHPENRTRLDACGNLPETEIISGEEYLTLVHRADYVAYIREVCEKGGGYLDPDTIVSPKSYEAAVKAVGATITASETGGIALGRPPGHHAYPGHASGFCVFNNIAIAAQKLVNEGKKILIFDFDGHLGDGTASYFYDSDRVMYWSVHQYPAYPGGGSEHEIGGGAGKGYSINVPLPPGSGDDILFNMFDRYRFLDIAKKFNPDVVGISAGFDAHQYDFLLGLRFSMNAYYKMGKLFKEVFGNVFATLEGGYNVEYFPKLLHNFIDGVNGAEMKYEEQSTESTKQVINEFEARAAALEKNLLEVWKV